MSAAVSVKRSLGDSWWIGGSLFGVLLLLADQLRGTGLSWVIAALPFGALWMSYRRPDLTVLGVGLRTLRGILLVVGCAVTFFVLGGQINDNRKDAARHIVELSGSDALQTANLLKAADANLLAEVRKLNPGLAIGEEVRRSREQEATAAEQQAAQKPKLAAIEARLKKLDSDDYAGRISAYREILALAPANTEWPAKIEVLKTAKAEVDERAEHPDRYVSLAKYDWYRDGFGSIMMLNATLKNDSSVNLKDWTIRCVHNGPSGTVMDSNERIAYEVVKAHSKNRVRKLNMGFISSQAVKSSCDVTHVERVK